MPRIVKREAKAINRTKPGAPENTPENCYWESDTVLIDKDWRDQALREMMDKYKQTAKEHCIKFNELNFEAGFSACLEALDKI